MDDPDAGEAGDFLKMADFLKSVTPDAIMVDATASDAVSDYYQVAREGRPRRDAEQEGGLGRPQALSRVQEGDGGHRRDVGRRDDGGRRAAILNVLRTDLVGTGDKVKTIEGIFSGTLSYIFNTYKPGMKFSDVIADAKEKGFTEPDPARRPVGHRRRAQGDDPRARVRRRGRPRRRPRRVARAGALQSWAPKEGEVLADAFIKEMEAFDAEKDALIKKATEAGNLRFVGVVDLTAKNMMGMSSPSVKVELKEYPLSHPFAGTQFADNICAFSTERYAPQPLVVQGPGAGAAVTAAGIFADVIKVAQAC